MEKSLTYSEYFFEKILLTSTNQNKKSGYRLISILLGSILLALTSKISFVLPFTPVPVTLQTFAVLFLSMVFGRNSVYMVGLWILEGIFGLPVFSKGVGIHYLLGPTGGYIIGFLVASYVCGYLAEYGFDKNFFKTFFCMILGNLIIYFFGIFWLLRFVDFDVLKAVCIGILPFVVGDIIKIVFATLILPSGWKLIK